MRDGIIKESKSGDRRTLVKFRSDARSCRGKQGGNMWQGRARHQCCKAMTLPSLMALMQSVNDRRDNYAMRVLFWLCNWNTKETFGSTPLLIDKDRSKADIKCCISSLNICQAYKDVLTSQTYDWIHFLDVASWALRKRVEMPVFKLRGGTQINFLLISVLL